MTFLHPLDQPIDTWSWGIAAAPGQQGGSITVGESLRASIWSGTPGSRIDLHPSVATSSVLRDIDGQDQVGWTIIDGSYVASIWNGSAGSWRRLSPPNTDYSVVLGAAGGQQVGQINANATLWNGTIESRVSLHPAGATWSTANATWGGRQVGAASFTSGDPQAMLWNGTASSWVSLHPSGVTPFSIDSYALSIWGTQQVGYVDGLPRENSPPELNWSAALWSGSASSWVDLHPAGATRSIAYDVYNAMQVGDAVFPDRQRALLWHGSATDYEDLSIPLAEATGQPWSCLAQSISSDGETLFVIGHGYNPTAQRREAILWSRPIPTPHATTTLVALGLTLLRRRRGRGSL